MRFIEEIVVDSFLPTIRSMLAESLREKGYTQREVATSLGISQSAVSKYAHGNVERHPLILEDPRVQDIVDDIASGLAAGEVTQLQALVELEIFIRQLEHGDLLSQLHEEAVPALAGYDYSFSIHDPTSEIRESEQVLSSVRRGLQILRDTHSFMAMIPNVGSNLVECLSDAETIEEVAGVPGRLFDVTGQLSVPADPSFGASEHVAMVLLAARSAGSDARAAINIRFDETYLFALENAGYRAVEFDAEYDGVSKAIQDAYTAESTVLYQSGGFGIEPIIYVLGPDAETTARRIRELGDNA